MKIILKIEDVFLLLLAIFLFGQLDFAWWWFLVLFLAPDLSFAGYLFGPRVGAVIYNIAHHRGIAIGLYILGAIASNGLSQLIGTVMLGHSAFDRALGYGLKYPDSFRHTHLGWIGREKPDVSAA